MYYHKSVGLALGMLAVPRIALRLTTKIPPHHAGLHKVETLAADGGHLLLYGLLTAMPATGVAMGYFGERARTRARLRRREDGTSERPHASISGIY